MPLAITQDALGAIQRGIQHIPIEAAPRMVGLVTARNVATEALKLAHQALDKLKAAVGELAEVGAYISQHGLGALLGVRSASFEASLNAARVASSPCRRRSCS